MYRQDTFHSAAFPRPFLGEMSDTGDTGGEPRVEAEKNRIELL